MTTTISKPERRYAVDTLDFRRALALRKEKKGGRVSTPGEVFAILRAIGFQRDGNMSLQSQAREFADSVKDKLIRVKRVKPTCSEIISVMRSLGYRRESAA